MGQKISQSKNTIDISVYLNKYYPYFSRIKVLNNGMLNKTVLLTNDDPNKCPLAYKCPLVAKIFFKQEYEEEYTNQLEKLIETQNKLVKECLHNELPLIYKMENQRSGIIFRQYLEYNLKERIYLMPYLNNIQKVWISLQILYAVNELTEIGIVHGDLKPENILLTSNLSVYISDIATYKPGYISMNDIGNYTYFFGNNSNDILTGCYFAPERLLDKGENIDSNKTFSMDVFSVGLIIAELFIEKNIFDFPKLLNYKKNNIDYKNIEELLAKLPDNVCKIIKDMIKINPGERITIKEALNRFSYEVCPITMTGFLLHFNTIVNSTSFWKPDLVIGFIYRYWIPLWKMIYGPDDPPSILYQHLNLAIINKIILENPFMQNYFSGKFTRSDDNEFLYLKNYKLLFEADSGNINESGMKELKEKYNKNHNQDCAFIIINFLLQNMQNTKYDSTNLVALEMVKCLSFKLDDITKLQFIIPYFVENLKRENFTTKIVSLNYLFEIFYSIDYKTLILPVAEYNYFDSYVFPVILDVFKLQNHELILEFFNNIDKIIDLQEKFMNLTMKSKLLIINKLYEEQKEGNMLQKKSKGKDKRSEIFEDYDTSMDEFKSSLFKVIEDLLGEINDIDILITVIRKLPKLFLFYGRSKSNDFIKFIVIYFNTTDWILQKEIISRIPEMMITLGKNEYILSCIEMLIDKNSNELKTLELIKAVNELLKMDYLTQKSAVEFFYKLMPFLIHPNIKLKKEVIKFYQSLIKYLSPEEAFSYLYEPLSEYLNIPPIFLNEDILNNYTIERINRVAYQLEFRRKEETNTNNINKKNQNENLEMKLYNRYKKQLELLKDVILRQKDGTNEVNEEINYSYEGSNEKDPRTYLIKYKEYSLKEPIEKYIKKEYFNLNDKSEKKDLLHKIAYKIFYLTDSTEAYSFSFPYIKDNRSCSFKVEDNILNSELFNIFYILKTLSLQIKSINVNELLHSKKKHRSITTDKGIHILSNHYYSKGFQDWRPQGQIVTTLYDHDKSHVEKLLPFPGNKFCSFDNEGRANIFKIFHKENEESIIVKKIWYSGDEVQVPIKYRNTITLIDNLKFLAASGNKIYSYDPSFVKDSKQIIKVLCQSDDGSNITCLKPFGKNSLENQKILIGTEKEGLSIYDQRMKNMALKNKIPISHGMINCISETFSKNNFYIGTLGGHLLYYDLRLNSIVKDYIYSDNAPILGIIPYKLNKNSNYDLSSILKSQNYYIIWTAAFDHEIGLWNSANLHCDLLLKVNTLEFRDEFRPLTVEIPYLSQNNLSNNIAEKRRRLKNELNSIIKFSHRYNNNFTNSLILSNLDNKLNENSFKIFSNMTNLYDNPSTVQCVVSPLCESNITFNKNIEYNNSSYLLSAGNDMIIRYWDITREGINSEKKSSYIVNAPNNLTYCNFTKSNFDKTNILQSNEAFNEQRQRTDMPGFSNYLNYNGVSLHYIPQNEFDSGINNLKFCSRISDPSHKSIITDILPMNIEEKNPQLNILVSSSWDGKIKIWK